MSSNCKYFSINHHFTSINSGIYYWNDYNNDKILWLFGDA